MQGVCNGNHIALYFNRLARQSGDALDEKLFRLKREAENHDIAPLRRLKTVTDLVNDEIVPAVKSRHHGSAGDHKGLCDEKTHRKNDKSRQKRKADKVPPRFLFTSAYFCFGHSESIVARHQRGAMN